MAPTRVIVAAMIVGIWASGCRTEPIRDFVDAPLPPHDAATIGEIDQAIWRIGRKLDWQAQIVEPGTLDATLKVRRHVATVRITHDDRCFSIRYVDSQNLNHHGDRIHRSYNRWVHRLKLKIQEEDF